MLGNIILQVSCPPGYTCLPSFAAVLNNPKALLLSIGIALFYGVAGYMNAINQNGETFNKTMFVKTIVVSLVVGAFMVWAGIDPTTGYNQAALFITGNSAVMLIIDQFVNALFNLAGELRQAPAAQATGQ